jgi:hypothetical protein
MRLEHPGYQTRSLMGSDAKKIEPAIQAHKSADSEGVVVHYARMCRLRLTEEVELAGVLYCG